MLAPAHLAGWSNKYVGMLTRAGAPAGRWIKAHRRILIGLCALLFIGGTAWSALQLDLSPGELRWRPLVLMALVAAPLTLLHGSLALVLLGQAIGAPARLGWAARTSAYGQLAELLPLPGGAIVRTGALVAAGGSLADATVLVLSSALLWISLAAGAAGAFLAIVAGQELLGLPLIFAGALGVPLFTAILWHKGGRTNALLTVVHRTVGLLLGAFRLQLAFAAIGSAVGLSATLPFVMANVAGSAASIAPSGLGIAEALAALLANTVAIAPAAAFLAVALDRLVSAGFVALVVGALQLRAR
jgi:hypothetical protein